LSWGAGPVRDRWGIGNSASPGRRSDKIVNGKSGISPEMAIRLTKAFGSTEETWLGMQLAYDLAAARKDEGKIKVRRYPVPQELHV
jgi:plasmid maintenance system antidote protein VapI